MAVVVVGRRLVGRERAARLAWSPVTFQLATTMGRQALAVPRALRPMVARARAATLQPKGTRRHQVALRIPAARVARAVRVAWEARMVIAALGVYWSPAR